MKNNFKKFISVLLMVLILSISFTPVSHAVALIMDLIYLDNDSNISVVISYESEKPYIAFISPEDETLEETDGRITVVEKDKRVNYQIRNAVAGQWKMKYDKKSNASIDYTAVLFDDAIYVESVSIGKVTDSTLPVTFKASNGKEGDYTYEISALTSKNAYTDSLKILKTGWATLNEEQTVDVDLNELNTYDSYYICVTAMYEGTDGVELSDSKICDTTFSYKNSNAPEKISNYSVYVDLTEKTATVDLESEEKPYCDSFIVSIFNSDDKSEPISFSQIDGDENIVRFILDDENISKYTVSVCYIDDGLTSESLEKSFDLKATNRTATIDTPEVTNSSEVTVSYTFDADLNVTLKVNTDDENDKKMTIASGSSFISEPLEDGENTIKFTYPLGDGVFASIGKEITVDKIAPMITLYENMNHITTTESTYSIIGKTEFGSTVKIADKEVELDDNNCFSYETKLDFGENLIKIEAQDKAGNISSTYALIEMKSALGDIENYSVKDFIPLIISAIVCTILMILYLFVLKRKNKEEKERKPGKASMRLSKFMVIVISVLLGADAAVLAWRIYTRISLSKFMLSMDFYNLVENSFDDAYSKVSVYNGTLKEIIIFSVAFVVLFVLLILFAKLFKNLKNKPPKDNAENIPETVEPKNDNPSNQNVQRNNSGNVNYPENEGYVCPKCGRKHDVKPNFCENCGHRFNS